MVNIGRVPHTGRNFETFSEDPLLPARMAAEEVQGMEGEKLIARVNHHVANNFEEGRTSASAEVPDGAFHEVDLPGLEATVRAVLCACNRVNRVHACDAARCWRGSSGRSWDLVGG